MHRSSPAWALGAVLAFASAPASAGTPAPRAKPTASTASPTTASPSAKDRAEARKRANAAFEAFKVGNYEMAIAEFEAAEELVHAPPHLLYIARSKAKLGRLLEAADTLRKLMAEQLPAGAPPAFAAAQKSASEDLAELERRTPKLSIAIEAPAGAQVRVSIDGNAVVEQDAGKAIPVDPGKHTVRAEAVGLEPVDQEVTAEDGGGIVAVTLKLEPAGATAGSEDEEEANGDGYVPPLGAVLLGGGGILVLAAGGVTGGLALSKAGELKDACPSNPCPTENESLADDANLLATISTVSFIVGGVATAGGLAWLLVDLLGGESGDGSGADAAEEVGLAARPLVGPGFVGVAGTFQ